MLIVDGNNLAMREGFARPGLFHNGMPTGAIFGFLKRIQVLTTQYPGEVCFCWDSPPMSGLRRQFWSGYKANRIRSVTDVPRATVNIRIQINLLMTEILPMMGYPNQSWQNGFEADDLVGDLCKGHLNDPMKIIVSSDSDLFQLLGPRVYVYDPGKKKEYHWSDLQNDYGVLPDLWPMVKAIAGDSSDGIDGVPGVGIKTAVKHLITGSDGGKLAQKIKAHQDIIDRNLKLVTLPWPGCDPGPIMESRFDQAGFRDVCLEYGLGSLV